MLSVQGQRGIGGGGGVCVYMMEGNPVLRGGRNSTHAMLLKQII